MVLATPESCEFESEASKPSQTHGKHKTSKKPIHKKTSHAKPLCVGGALKTVAKKGGVEKGPACNAPYVYLYDMHGDKVLFERNAHQKMPPSSMTKIVTLYYLFREIKDGHLKWDDGIHVSTRASRRPGSRMFLRSGETVALLDLVKGIVVSSGNDACCAVAESVAGSEEEFGQILTQMTKDLGLKQTHLMNGSGLPHGDHWSSAYDLYWISRKTIEDFPDFYKQFYALKTFCFNKIAQPNRNLLLKDMGVDGLKTGMTDSGGYGIVVSKKLGERRLILVINGLKTAQERAAEARRLLSWGFQNFITLVLKKGTVVGSTQVWNQKELLDVVLEHDLKLCLPKATVRKAVFKVQICNHVLAPVKKGQCLGALIVEIPEHPPLKISLVAQTDVRKQSILSRVWKTLVG